MNRTASGIILPSFPERIIKTRSGKEKKVEYKIIAGSLKATNDQQGIVEGYLNAIGNIDYGKDRTMPGAFKQTLSLSYKRKAANKDDFLWPYLWNHDSNLLPPGGIFDADEDKKGLFIKAQLNLDYQLGRDVYSSYKFGSVKKQSMGYLAHQVEWVREDGDMIRNLLEVEILEGSGVIFPMNDESDITDVKSAANSNRRHFVMPEHKTRTPQPQRKDFNDRYRQQQIADWQWDDWQALVIALKQSVMDAFASGDTPQTDLVDIILNDADDSKGFISALKDYVQAGIDLDYSNYLQEQSDSYGDSYYEYMSRRNPALALKSGASFSQANTDAIHSHVAALHSMADEQCKAMHTAANGLLDALSGLGAPSSPSVLEQGTTGDEDGNPKHRRTTRSRKAGAEFSQDNLQMLSEHVGDLHDVADTIHQMAEDLAQNTGAATYTDPDGNPDDAKETDKNKARPRLDAPGRKQPLFESTAVSAGDVSTALSRLNAL